MLNRLGLCLFLLGEEERGDEVMRESLELARRSGSNDQLATAFVNYADALHLAGPQRGGGWRSPRRATGRSRPGDRSALWIACARSEILFDLGRWDEAEAVAAAAQQRRRAAATLANLLLRRATRCLGRGDYARGAARRSNTRGTCPADSVEPQYIAPAGALDGRTRAARAATSRRPARRRRRRSTSSSSAATTRRGWR